MEHTSITSRLRRQPRMPALGGLAAVFVIVTGLAWGVLSLIWPETPVHVHVRWKPGVTDAQRVELERRFQLTDSAHAEGTTWEYQLTDSSTANIRAIVQHERVDDTAHLNRIRHRPEFAQDRSRQMVVYSVAIGAIGSILLLVMAVGFGRTASFSLSWSQLTAAVSSRVASAGGSGRILRAFSRSAQPPGPTIGSAPMTLPGYSQRATGAVLLTGVLATIAMTAFAGASPWSAAGALIIVHVCGYVVGSLLVGAVEGVAWALIRTVAGLLLTTIGFLLCLVLSLPWLLAPGALVATAVWLRGSTAFAWPASAARFRSDGMAAGILVAILVSPVVITFLYMAPGSFPPVFYNVDTPYFLEKVHRLSTANGYPPESLGNVGVRRTYHYGTQAMAALISRGSGLPPHHSVFLIVLPLLVAGVIAAAVAAARCLGPALPRSVTVPLLLLSTPSLTGGSFWSTFGPQLGTAARSGRFSIDAIVGDYGLWGILSNEGQNVGGDFLILASVAGIAAARPYGWRLPAFLIGSSILVKTPAGVALFAGFVLAEAWRAARQKRLRPSPQILMAATIFAVTTVAFFLASLESNFRVEVFPLFYWRQIVGRGLLAGVVLDIAWLLLPALIVLSAGIRDPEKRSVPILLMALAPLVVVNTTRMDNIIAGGGGTGGDWLQMLHSVPFLLHAFALSLAGTRWSRLGRPRRAAFLLMVALTIAPVATAAARYSFLLLRDPESGHEFVDNHPLAEALAVIPRNGTMIVTNDLRYPAQGFTRDDRQIQIPALFGHQAFAVNYVYEPVEERRGLQQFLQRPEWTEAIPEAARTHGWTHLVIRKDYVHPERIPLEPIFENQVYAVFRFP